MVRKAVAGGGTTYNEPQDRGFMSGHGFQDRDGHIWGLIYVEPSVAKPAKQGQVLLTQSQGGIYAFHISQTHLSLSRHARGSGIGRRQKIGETDGPAGDDGDVQEASHAR